MTVVQQSIISCMGNVCKTVEKKKVKQEQQMELTIDE